MNNKLNIVGILTILLSLGIIAVYASIQTAFLTGLVTALVAPPTAVLVGMVHAGRKFQSYIEML
ncbi:MAG TPA: hypothetical protein VF354_00245 [Candidatus Methanoperedens sp.]